MTPREPDRFETKANRLLKNPPPWPSRPAPCWHYCKDGGACAQHGHCMAICACGVPSKPVAPQSGKGEGK